MLNTSARFGPLLSSTHTLLPHCCLILCIQGRYGSVPQTILITPLPISPLPLLWLRLWLSFSKLGTSVVSCVPSSGVIHPRQRAASTTDLSSGGLILFSARALAASSTSTTCLSWTNIFRRPTHTSGFRQLGVRVRCTLPFIACSPLFSIHHHSLHLTHSFLPSPPLAVSLWLAVLYFVSYLLGLSDQCFPSAASLNPTVPSYAHA